MASPQTENGYTMIANELFDALINFRICGEHRQVLDFIIRKTYGFKKKTDAIPLSQFVKATGIQKAHVIRAINALKLCNIIKGAKTGTFDAVIYGINKDYMKWRKVPKRALLPKRAIKGAETGNEKVPKQAHSKERKESTQKKKEYASVPPLKDVKEFSLPKVGADIQNLADRLYEEKKFPRVHAFVNSMIKKKVNSRAILHALTRVYLKPPDNKDFNPWAYALQIIKVENGNYNEQLFRKVTPKDS